MKYFVDTEFSEKGPKYPIELISIGIVDENDREFYAINSAWYGPWWQGEWGDRRVRQRASKWVQENVLSNLPTASDANMTCGGSPRMNHEWMQIMSLSKIKEAILDFIGNDPAPEFWGYYADYDWVVFCQIFGAMVDLPKGWPMYCRDLKQLVDEKGNPKLPNLPNTIEHHALYDARETKMRYYWLIN